MLIHKYTTTSGGLASDIMDKQIQHFFTTGGTGSRASQERAQAIRRNKAIG